MELCGWGRHWPRRYTYGIGHGLRRHAHARPRARRLHPLLGLQPQHRPARPRHRHRRGAQARRAPDRRRSPPRRARQQGRPLAARAARHRRRARPRHRRRHDRARLVRPRLRPRLDERPAARARGHRPPAHRARPLPGGQRAASTSPGTTPRRDRSSTIRRPAATSGMAPSRPSSASTRSRHRAGDLICRPAFELMRRSLPALLAGDGRGDLLGRARSGRGRRPACSGRRARSPTTPGAASSSTPTSPSSPGPSRCSTPSPAASTRRAATCSSRPCRPRTLAARSWLPAEQRARTLGLAERPLGPASGEDRHLGRALPRHPGGAAHTPCAAWSASAPICSSPTPTACAGARRWRRSTSTSTPTCS